MQIHNFSIAGNCSAKRCLWTVVCKAVFWSVDQGVLGLQSSSMQCVEVLMRVSVYLWVTRNCQAVATCSAQRLVVTLTYDVLGAWLHADVTLSTTQVLLSRERACGTVYRLLQDRSPDVDSLGNIWKRIYSRHCDCWLLGAVQILFLTYLCTHPFSGPLSWTTRVSRYLKDKTNLDFTEARDSE